MGHHEHIQSSLTGSDLSAMHRQTFPVQKLHRLPLFILPALACFFSTPLPTGDSYCLSTFSKLLAIIPTPFTELSFSPADLTCHRDCIFSSVQSLSRVQLFVTPWTAARQAFLSITNSQSLLKLMSIGLVMPFNHLILCHPLLLPSIPPSISVFSNESGLCITWPKYWSFSFSISPSNEYSGLISFRMDRLDLLAVQGALKGLIQHHSSKASILQRSAFFIVQLSHPYLTTGKTIAFTRQTFVGKVMSAF